MVPSLQELCTDVPVMVIDLFPHLSKILLISSNR